LKNHPEVYTTIDESAAKIVEGFAQNHKELGVAYTINRVGSMFTQFFTNRPVHNFDDAKASDTVMFGRYFQGMLREGIYLAPSQYEALFVSAAIGDSEIDRIVTAHKKVIKSLI
ncbi:MAG TPA: hypothetical protein VL947_07355, partial [Cytophagales bacterium]|nr:hypothetical protein [Cytophagales bacterium]